MDNPALTMTEADCFRRFPSGAIVRNDRGPGCRQHCRFFSFRFRKLRYPSFQDGAAVQNADGASATIYNYNDIFVMTPAVMDLPSPDPIMFRHVDGTVGIPFLDLNAADFGASYLLNGDQEAWVSDKEWRLVFSVRILPAYTI